MYYIVARNCQQAVLFHPQNSILHCNASAVYVVIQSKVENANYYKIWVWENSCCCCPDPNPGHSCSRRTHQNLDKVIRWVCSNIRDRIQQVWTSHWTRGGSTEKLFQEFCHTPQIKRPHHDSSLITGSQTWQWLNRAAGPTSAHLAAGILMNDAQMYSQNQPRSDSKCWCWANCCYLQMILNTKQAKSTGLKLAAVPHVVLQSQHSLSSEYCVQFL